MSVDLRAVNPTSPVPEITRKRLWFLYCYVGLIKAEIARVTGWDRQLIDSRLQKWKLTKLSGTYVETEFRLSEAVAKQLGLPWKDLTDFYSVQGDRRALQEKMQAALQSRSIDWESIDSLPDPQWHE